MDKVLDQLFSEDPADATSGSERGISFVKNRLEAVGFPKGWYREELIRSGAGVINPGHKIVHYFSPDGRKYRSKAELMRVFGSRFDMTNFDFKSEKLLGFSAAKKSKSSQLRGPSTGSLINHRFLEPPTRQCSCMVPNQKVRIIETCGENVCKEVRDLPRASIGKTLKPKPAQIYWAKRLENCRRHDQKTDSMPVRALPNGFKAATSLVSDSTAVASLTASIYSADNQGYFGPENVTVIGQTQNMDKIRQNPGVYINPYQPLVSATKVTMQLIEQQELQVQRLRRDLARMLSQRRREQA